MPLFPADMSCPFTGKCTLNGAFLSSVIRTFSIFALRLHSQNTLNIIMKKIMLLGSGRIRKNSSSPLNASDNTSLPSIPTKMLPQCKSHEREIINMLDGAELDRIVAKHRPDIIVPEIEAIRTERFMVLKQAASKSCQAPKQRISP